jgi:hypothetical protein
MLGVAELAPEETRSNLQDSLHRTAAGEPPALLSWPRDSTSLASLEALLRVRVAAVQQAVSNLKQVEQDG